MTATDSYTPGWDDVSVAFMARRRLNLHGQELLPLLRPDFDVVDVGCGPAVMSREIATLVAAGSVVGIDLDIDQIEQATLPSNLTVRAGTAYALPLEDDSVDIVFAHAVLEHLSRPVAALAEFARVLRPGGHAVIVSPDWDGFVVAPDSAALASALRVFTDRLRAGGGDPRAGRQLGEWLLHAGFSEPVLRARYECYDNPHVIAEYLARQLDQSEADAAGVLRHWATERGRLFAQCWISATATIGAKTPHAA